MIFRKINFFFRFSIFFLSLIFLFSSIFADTNGVWISANDISSGIFGSDEVEQGFEFNSDLYYLGVEINDRYINVGENDSVFSFMIIDGEVKSVDVGDGEVFSIDIKNRTINSSDLQDSGVGVISFDFNSITSEDIKNDTLISSNFNYRAIRNIDIRDESILSSDIKDGSVNRDDVSFNYAGSNSKGGDALNSLNLLGYNQEDGVPIINTSEIIYYIYNSYFLNPFGESRLENLFLDGFRLSSLRNCVSLKSSSSEIQCSSNSGIDLVDDADNDPNNELPLAGDGISISGRKISLNGNFMQRVSRVCDDGYFISSIDLGGNVNCVESSQNQGSRYWEYFFQENYDQIPLLFKNNILYLPTDPSLTFTSFGFGGGGPSSLENVNFPIQRYPSNFNSCNSGEYVYAMTAKGSLLCRKYDEFIYSKIGRCPEGMFLKGIDSEGNFVCDFASQPSNTYPVEGACGVAAESYFSTQPPNGDLCSAGNPTNPIRDSSNDVFTWTCSGVDGGDDTSCSTEPPFCGNGIVEGSEECDAGEENGGQGSFCSSNCEFNAANGNSCSPEDITYSCVNSNTLGIYCNNQVIDVLDCPFKCSYSENSCFSNDIFIGF